MGSASVLRVYGFRTDPQAAREPRGLRIRLACANLIEGTASAHDAALSKPAPDIVQAALRKSGGDARAAIMIGDTPNDVETPLRGQIITSAAEAFDQPLTFAVLFRPSVIQATFSLITKF